MEETKRDREHYTQSMIIDRGWSKSMIDKLLGEPDDFATNPHYKNSSPLKLYLISRVTSIECTEEFINLKLKKDKKSKVGVDVAFAKREKLLKEINETEIEVEVLPSLELRKLSIESYNDRHQWLVPTNISDKIDKFFLDKMKVNYIRHHLTIYDELLNRIARNVGVDDAYILLQNKIFDAIKKAYPSLKTECNRQKRAKLKEIKNDTN